MLRHLQRAPGRWVASQGPPTQHAASTLPPIMFSHTRLGFALLAMGKARAKNGSSEADRLGIVGLKLSWTPAPVPEGRPAVLLHWERTNSSRGLLAAYDLSLYFLEPLILIHNHPPFRAPRPRFPDQCYDLLLITRAKLTALSHLRTTKPPVCNHPSPIA